MIRRRRFFVTTAALPFIGGCSIVDKIKTVNWDQVATVVASDANAVAALIKNAFTQMAALHVPGITPDVLTIGMTALSGIQSTAAAIAGARDLATAQPLVLKLASYASAALGAVASVPGLPVTVSALLAGASLLVTLVASAIQIYVPQPPVPANAPPVTVDEARKDALIS
jgi:hypothetical protein